MTLRVMLLRHAKSDRPDGVADERRPLAARGRRDSPWMGRQIMRKGLLPDLALVSTACRAQETWQAVSSAFDRRVPARNEPRLYEATSRGLFELVKETGPEIASLLLVGHNPGLHEFALALIGSGDRQDLARLRDGLPTAGLVIIDLAVDTWSALATGRGILQGFETPGRIE
jgi:phosphohistidine phosphatase